MMFEYRVAAGGLSQFHVTPVRYTGNYRVVVSVAPNAFVRSDT